MNGRGMRSQTNYRLALGAAALFLIAVSGATLAVFLSESARVDAIAPSDPRARANPPRLPVSASVRIGVPVRLFIPSLDLAAPVERVGLTPEGAMDVPKDPLDVGWYEIGPRPGETGSATIAGHVDWVHGATAVFADLHELRPGDTIAVQDDKGAYFTFVVRETRKYDAAEEAKDVFHSDDGKAHLNLITCDGVWQKSAKQYSERLVVFADKAM